MHDPTQHDPTQHDPTQHDPAQHAAAITWAESALGAGVQRVEALTGGMTSTMLALTDTAGGESVLRLMTNEPWRTHGPALTQREHDALTQLLLSEVPAPASIALHADGSLTGGVAAHLMTRLPGEPAEAIDQRAIFAMAEMLATIHAVQPTQPFRTYQSWAWEAKWVIPEWSQRQESWQRAFDLLARTAPGYQPTFLHRDFSHRNLLWQQGEITGVVDWVETSSGPADLDAGHAATNLAVAFGMDCAEAFLHAYNSITGQATAVYWLVMDAVGFLPPPGKQPMFAKPEELARLDQWLHHLITTG